MDRGWLGELSQAVTLPKECRIMLSGSPPPAAPIPDYQPPLLASTGTSAHTVYTQTWVHTHIHTRTTFSKTYKWNCYQINRNSSWRHGETAVNKEGLRVTDWPVWTDW